VHDKRIGMTNFCSSNTTFQYYNYKKHKQLIAQLKSSADAFYWPLLDVAALKLDSKGMPRIYQNYSIPDSFQAFDKSNVHNRALFSIWNHFVSYFSQPVDEVENISRQDNDTNRFLGCSRLQVFIDLASALE
jgi:hypothetical protein